MPQGQTRAAYLDPGSIGADCRIHLSDELWREVLPVHADGNDDVWYKFGSRLYVQQVTPPAPTPDAINFDKDELTADFFRGFSTLMPHLTDPRGWPSQGGLRLP